MLSLPVDQAVVGAVADLVAVSAVAAVSAAAPPAMVDRRMDLATRKSNSFYPFFLYPSLSIVLLFLVMMTLPFFASSCKAIQLRHHDDIFDIFHLSGHKRTLMIDFPV